jgi:hypothetical protein
LKQKLVKYIPIQQIRNKVAIASAVATANAKPTMITNVNAEVIVVANS